MESNICCFVKIMELRILFLRTAVPIPEMHSSFFYFSKSLYVLIILCYFSKVKKKFYILAKKFLRELSTL